MNSSVKRFCPTRKKKTVTKRVKWSYSKKEEQSRTIKKTILLTVTAIKGSKARENLQNRRIALYIDLKSLDKPICTLFCKKEKEQMSTIRDEKGNQPYHKLYVI